MQNIVVTFLGVVPLTGTPSSLGNDISIRLLRWCRRSSWIPSSWIISACSCGCCGLISILTRGTGSRVSWIIIFRISWSSSPIIYWPCCTSIRCWSSSCCIWISWLLLRICGCFWTAISTRSNMATGCRISYILVLDRIVLINCSCFWQIVIWCSHICNLTLLVTYWWCLRSIGLLMS